MSIVVVNMTVATANLNKRRESHMFGMGQSRRKNEKKHTHKRSSIELSS